MTARVSRITDGLASVFGLLGLVVMAFIDPRLGGACFLTGAILLAVRPVAGIVRGRRA